MFIFTRTIYKYIIIIAFINPIPLVVSHALTCPIRSEHRNILGGFHVVSMMVSVLPQRCKLDGGDGLLLPGETSHSHSTGILYSYSLKRYHTIKLMVRSIHKRFCEQLSKLLKHHNMRRKNLTRSYEAGGKMFLSCCLWTRNMNSNPSPDRKHCVN